MQDSQQSEQILNQNMWLIYEAEKSKLAAMNLSPEEYEIRIRELIEVLRI